MNRQEYLSKLESGLGSMSYKDVKEILAEISEYFDEGIAAGKTEEELAIKLGSPEYLARAYAEGTALPPDVMWPGHAMYPGMYLRFGMMFW